MLVIYALRIIFASIIIANEKECSGNEHCKVKRRLLFQVDFESPDFPQVSSIRSVPSHQIDFEYTWLLLSGLLCSSPISCEQ